jgi:hypothetical protein
MKHVPLSISTDKKILGALAFRMIFSEIPKPNLKEIFVVV